ncbi:hypothetical protein K438DRAFT_1987231 [Mycena galopus ATCC 62051]|nr:hypothetical protein K438DRAFT_1987231 [Mycena galopus ATCC 62051]
MIAFAVDVTPSTSFIGESQSDLTWTVTQPELVLGVVDSHGTSGGIASPLYTVTPVGNATVFATINATINAIGIRHTLAEFQLDVNASLPNTNTQRVPLPLTTSRCVSPFPLPLMTMPRPDICPYCGQQLAIKTSKGGAIPGSQFVSCTNPHANDRIYFHRFPTFPSLRAPIVPHSNAPPPPAPVVLPPVPVAPSAQSVAPVQPAAPAPVAPLAQPAAPVLPTANTISVGAQPTCTHRNCNSTRLDPACSRNMCRRHCSLAGFCSLRAHERNRQRAQVPRAAAAPGRAPASAPLTPFALVPAPAPAQMISLPQHSACIGSRRDGDLSFDAVDYASHDEWLANTLPGIRALNNYTLPLPGELRHLDDLPGVRSPTPDDESVHERLEHLEREDAAHLQFGLHLSRAEAARSQARGDSSAGASSSSISPPLQLPVSILQAGEPSLFSFNSTTPSPTPTRSLPELRSLSISPDFPATLAPAVLQRATQKRPLRLTRQLNEDWNSLSLNATPTLHVKKVVSKRFILVFWTEANMPHRVVFVESKDVPFWPTWHVANATTSLAKALGTELDVWMPKFKTWAEIQVTSPHTVAPESVLMLRRRDLECDSFDETVRTFYPANTAVHIRTNLPGDRAALRRLYKQSKVDDDDESDVEIVATKKVKSKKRAKANNDDELAPSKIEGKKRAKYGNEDLHIDTSVVVVSDDDDFTLPLTAASSSSSLPATSSSSMTTPAFSAASSPLLESTTLPTSTSSSSMTTPASSAASSPLLESTTLPSSSFEPRGSPPWPAFMSVAEMDTGFRAMDALPRGLSRGEHFMRVFCQHAYVPSTVTVQRAIYEAATAEELKKGIMAAGTRDGVWNVWRKTVAARKQ